MDQAAIAALQIYNPVSIMVDAEFGGSVCRLPTLRYFGSGVNRGLPETVTPRPCPPREPWVKVAEYHTHGTYGQEQFSGEDLSRVNVPPYFATYVATPCGLVHAYQGPPPTLPRGYIGLTDSILANRGSCVTERLKVRQQ